jgi:hypothetical protein
VTNPALISVVVQIVIFKVGNLEATLEFLPSPHLYLQSLSPALPAYSYMLSASSSFQLLGLLCPRALASLAAQPQ